MGQVGGKRKERIWCGMGGRPTRRPKKKLFGRGAGLIVGRNIVSKKLTTGSFVAYGINCEKETPACGGNEAKHNESHQASVSGTEIPVPRNVANQWHIEARGPSQTQHKRVSSHGNGSNIETGSSITIKSEELFRGNLRYKDPFARARSMIKNQLKGQTRLEWDQLYNRKIQVKQSATRQ